MTLALLAALGVVVSLAYAVGQNLIAAELFEWMPRWAERLIDCAVRRLPAECQARMREEWLAELHAIPGHLWKLRYAASLALHRPSTVDRKSLTGSDLGFVIWGTVLAGATGFAAAATGFGWLVLIGNGHPDSLWDPYFWTFAALTVVLVAEIVFFTRKRGQRRRTAADSSDGRH